MSLDLTEDKSTLVQVMAWCRQTTSHYLSQCWPRSVSPYGVIRPQWVKAKPHEISIVHNLFLSYPIVLKFGTFLSYPIVLKFGTEYSTCSDIALLCAKLQNDWTTETDVMDEQVFTRFEFEMSFRRIPQWVNLNQNDSLHIFVMLRASVFY